MPGVAAPIEGVINLRGTLVTIISGTLFVGQAHVAEGRRSDWFVVLRYRDGRVGLGVDEVGLTEAPGDCPFIEPEQVLEPIFQRAG